MTTCSSTASTGSTGERDHPKPLRALHPHQATGHQMIVSEVLKKHGGEEGLIAEAINEHNKAARCPVRPKTGTAHRQQRGSRRRGVSEGRTKVKKRSASRKTKTTTKKK